jgi:hypothetical protein
VPSNVCGDSRCDSPRNLIHVSYHCDSPPLVSTSPVVARQPSPLLGEGGRRPDEGFHAPATRSEVPKMGHFSRTRKLATPCQGISYRFSGTRNRADFWHENSVFRAGQQVCANRCAARNARSGVPTTTGLRKINHSAATNGRNGRLPGRREDGSKSYATIVQL